MSFATTVQTETSWENTTYGGLPDWVGVKNTFVDCPGERSLSLDEFMPMCKSCPTSAVMMTHFASKAPGSCAIPEETSEEDSTTDGTRTPDEATSDGSRTPPLEEDSWEKASTTTESHDSWENISYGELPVWTTVKNTFIDCPVDRSESLDEFLHLYVPQCKSCPASGVMMGQAESQVQEQATLSDAGPFDTNNDVSYTGSMAWADMLEEGEPQGQEVVVQVNLGTMLKFDESAPVLSAGSQAHHFGICRPCGFVHKPEGCSKGASCPFCHLCPAGTIKARKQAKKEVIKAKKAEFRMQQVSQMWMDHAM